MLTSGQILKKRRKQLRRSLSKVSQETRIQEQFLKYIEDDDYSKFDSGVFVNGFIKIYADYLGLDVDKLLALYRRSSKDISVKSKAVLLGKKESVLKKLLTPSRIIGVILSIAILIGLIYLNIQFQQFQKEPELEIVSPKPNEIVESEEVSVLGIADRQTEISLNGERLEVEKDGSFEADILLEEGKNTISIIAVNPNNSDKVTKKDIVIEYKKKGEQEKVEEVKIEKFTVKIEVTGEQAWTRLVVDDELKFDSILEPGITDEFEMKSTLVIGSGKPSITKVHINEEIYTLTSVGQNSLSCTVHNNRVECSN